MSPKGCRRCMNCGGQEVVPFLDLGDQPNGNAFPLESEVHDEPQYSLVMGVCRTCWQVQIMEFPDPETLFDDHPYVTGLNAPVVQHFAGLARGIARRFDLGRGDLMVDIGCNDGTLLSQFDALGVSGVGVEPGGRVNRLARAAGHVAFRAYWGQETGAALGALGLRPKIITATAVFYHVPDLHDFIRGLLEVMTEETVFVVQAVNMLDLLLERSFDHFYHEHSCIHSVMTLKTLFERHGLILFDVETSPIHGGSIVAYVSRADAGREVAPTVAAQIERERVHGLDKLDTYHRFGEEVTANAAAMRILLADLRQRGETVLGLGAPVKGSTLLNFSKIGPDLLPMITEVNPYKIGRLSPGTHIPIVGEDEIEEEPDYYLVLAWNYLDHFIERKRAFLEAGGKLIVPVPSPRVISAEDIGG